MKLSIHQQIINFIDQNDGATVGQILRGVNPDMVTMLAFEELLADGQLRQIVADKNLGTYKYHLPA